MSKISEMKSAIEKGYEYFSAQEMKSVIAEAEKQIDLLTLGLLQEKEKTKGMTKFVEYVASIDGAIVSDPDNENPLSMGELQADAKQALA